MIIISLANLCARNEKKMKKKASHWRKCYFIGPFSQVSDGKESACQRKRWRFDPWIRKIRLEREMATHSSLLAWRIPWTEEPDGLQSIGSQRVRYD